ncbi:MAG: sodium-dependent transporter [Methanotrichaceae archaeon]
MAREIWSSRTGFILAAIGSAVGLGNIWRFNYLAYDNGGGAFLIPYFVALFTAGISLMILEFALGNKFRGSAPLSMKRARESFEWIGWWAALAGFIITMYYVVIVGWALVYLTKAFTLGWGEDTNSYFFGNVLQMTDSSWNLGGFPIAVLVSLVTIWLITWFIEVKGVQRGIEKANKFFMPLLWILAIVLVARALTLPGALTGIDWYLKPNFDKLLDYNVWLAAYGQIFYTLSLGMAIMIAYASYLPKKSDIVNNAFIVSLANGAFSFLIGFAVFGTLGYMAATTGQGIEDVVASGIGLSFVVFPKALSLLPGLKVLTAVAFFTYLVVAGLSSLVSLVEAFASAVMDKFEMKRTRAVNITVGVGFLGSLIYATKGGLFWLDIVDHFINVYGLLVVGVLEAIAIGWIFGGDKIKNWVNKHSDVRAGIWWDLSIKLIVPLVLTWLIIKETLSNLAAPYGGYPQMAIYLGMAVMIIGVLLSFVLSKIKTEVK